MVITDRISRHTLLFVKNFLNRNTSCQEVLFVAGMQRSGTNMLMDVLERSVVTDVYHEWDNRAFTNYQMKERSVIRGLLGQSRGDVFVIKALCELQDLTELMADFKSSKTVWIFRQYQDVVNSMVRSFGNMNKQIIRLAEDPDSEAWLGKGMSQETHNYLIEMVTPGISLASASALQWYIRNILFFEQSFDDNERVLPIIYENLVKNTGNECKRMLEFLGVEYSRRIVSKIHSGSVGKRGKVQVDDDINALCLSLQQKIDGLFV